MEQRLYAQVIMISQKDSDNEKETGKTKIYNFQGKSSISIRWFDIYCGGKKKMSGHMNHISIKNINKIYIICYERKQMKYL